MFTAPLSTAVSAYDRARSAIAPQAGAPPASLNRPADSLTAGDRFMHVMQSVDATGSAALTGGASAQTLVQTVAEAELALETVVAIRDKVVEAYQEILRMPV